MSLSDLTDRNAVILAIHECNEMGRRQFLKKYGFGYARSYFLHYKREEYDSKAIVGVAYGNQFPEQGPLLSKQFSGGEDTVARKLRSLGFQVAAVSRK